MSSSRRERVERDWRLRRAVRAGVPPTRISNRVDRERDAAGQGQQELRGHRRPRDFLLRHKTIRCSTFPSERKTEHEILGHRVSTSVSVQREFRRRADAAVRGRHPIENHRGGVPEAQRQPDRVGETGRADARGRRTGVGGRRGPATRRRRQTGHHSHVDEDPAGRVLRVGDRLDRGRPVPVDRDQIVRHVQQRQTDKTRTSPSPVRLRVGRRR